MFNGLHQVKACTMHRGPHPAEGYTDHRGLRKSGLGGNKKENAQ